MAGGACPATAADAGIQLVVVPRFEGRYASIGVLSTVVEPVKTQGDGGACARVARRRRNVPLICGAASMADRPRRLSHLPKIADLAGHWPELDLEQKVTVLETVDLEDVPSRCARRSR